MAAYSETSAWALLMSSIIARNSDLSLKQLETIRTCLVNAIGTVSAIENSLIFFWSKYPFDLDKKTRISPYSFTKAS